MAQNYFGKTDSRGSTPVTYNFTPLSSAEPFSTSKPYTVGEYCFYEGLLYRCKTDKAAGAWAPTKFEEANLGEHLTDAEKALLTKAEIDGYYDGMTVGNAEQIVGTVFEEDDTAYNYRTTGGSAEVGDRAYVDAITGVSLPWNQLVRLQQATTTVSGVTFTKVDDGYIVDGTATPNANAYVDYNGVSNFTPNHVYAFWGCASGGSGSTYRLGLCHNGSSVANEYGGGALYKASSEQNLNLTVVIFVYKDTTVNNLKFRPQVFDLTAMFGSTIADYIYGLETAHAGDGVAWFKRYFPKPYYAYHAVGMEHVNAVSAKTVGFNQWDEDAESGYLNVDNGNPEDSASRYRSKNFIKVFPSTTYYFKTSAHADANSAVHRLYYYDENKNYIGSPEGSYASGTFVTPSNAHYMKFFVNEALSYYNHDINISIRWDNSRDGDYEPYNLHTYPLADITLRGIPKIDESGNLKFDGDRYLPNGTVERRYGIVDLGTLNWSVAGSNPKYFYAAPPNKRTNHSSSDENAIVCAKYTATHIIAAASSLDDKTMTEGYGQYPQLVEIRDDAYATAADFKTAMSGVYLVYELATPTTEEADPYQYPMVVDNWGTEEFVDGLVESGDRDVAIPVGHETKYPPNLKDKLESAANNPDADGAYILTHDGGSNTYTPLASNATIQNIIARLEALDGGGDNE